MKRRTIVLIAVCILLSICIGCVLWISNGSSTMVGQKALTIRKELGKDIIWDANCLLVLKLSNRRIICVTNNGTVVAEIRFDDAGTIISENGISPLKASLFDTSCPKTAQDMTSIFGNPHADIGSGVYLPTYILDDGRIVTYHMNGDNIVENTIKFVFDM